MEQINLFQQFLPKKYSGLVRINEEGVFIKKRKLDDLKLSSIVTQLKIDFNNQWIEPNLFWLLKKNKEVDKIIILKNKSYFTLKHNSTKYYVKNYLIYHYLVIKYFNKWIKKNRNILKQFEKDVLTTLFVNSDGYTSNCNIEVPFYKTWGYDDCKCRVDFCISLPCGNFIIEFNESTHLKKEYSSTKPESRIKTIMNNHYYLNKNFLGIRYVTDTILFLDKKLQKKAFFEIFNDLKNIIIINSISKDKFCINKINSSFPEKTNLGKLIYDNYKNENEFLIPIDEAICAYGLKGDDVFEYIKNKILFEEEEAQKTLSINYDDDFSDDDLEDSESEEKELNPYYHIKGSKLNFDGLIAIARQVNFNQEFSFSIQQIKNANQFLKNCLKNMIKAHEELYDTIKLNKPHHIYDFS
jgi:hypothetical protein